MQKNLTWTRIDELYPKENTPLYFKAKGSNRVHRGFFYLNGKCPVFASFGSDVENVEYWAYVPKSCMKGNRILRYRGCV